MPLTKCQKEKRKQVLRDGEKTQKMEGLEKGEAEGSGELEDMTRPQAKGQGGEVATGHV